MGHKFQFQYKDQIVFFTVNYPIFQNFKFFYLFLTAFFHFGQQKMKKPKRKICQKRKERVLNKYPNVLI